MLAAGGARLPPNSARVVLDSDALGPASPYHGQNGEAVVTQQEPRPGQSFAAAAPSFGSLAITLIVMFAALFWPAGTLEWPRSWIFLGLFLALTAVAMTWIWRTNPELFAARSRYQKGTKPWDAVVATLTITLFAAILPIGALDDGRFHWAPQPEWVVLIGYILMISGYLGLTWAQSVNRHFETTVRIQTDRDHKVIDTGPYAIIRHPGYATAIVLVFGMALSLGSLYALIPAGLIVIVLFGRTLGEEAELRKGLEGYAEYMERVRWRWIQASGEGVDGAHHSLPFRQYAFDCPSLSLGAFAPLVAHPLICPGGHLLPSGDCCKISRL